MQTRVLAFTFVMSALLAQTGAPPNSQPNPYRTSERWYQLPEGRTMGSTSAVAVAADGHIWVAERCGANSCRDSQVAPVLEFDGSGKLLRSWGAGVFVFPHGLTIDKDGNLWITDGQGIEGKGHQVFKFSPDGKALMTLGKAGIAGDGPDTFNQPNAVAIAPNGDIFVSDGHNVGRGNARVVKFSKDGKFIKQWGGHGSGPGQFEMPHTLAFDSKGRLFVGDRGNNRIQIFDQDGKFLEEWKQFSRPSGIFIDNHDGIYVADSESTDKDGYGHNPGWKRGIRIGSARDGSVTAYIPDPSPGTAVTSAAEGVTADAHGNVYGAEVGPKDVKKYVRNESGRLVIHMILHAVGAERYQIAPGDDGLKLATTIEYTDRANKRATAAEMRMRDDYTPVSWKIGERPASAGITATPFAVQMVIMRYWNTHGRPASLPVLRATAAAPAIEIRAAGRDTIRVHGKTVPLERFTVANLVFGREILWTNADGELAAAMTFAGGLPMEAVLDEYEDALPQLYSAGVGQEMEDQRELSRAAPPVRTGTFAIAGARLVDGTGAAAVEDSVVIVRDGRIAGVGARGKVAIPRGMAVVDAKGQTLLPGLWEMHTHYSGVEFGPALLAAGITTARDCGGEMDYLVAQRVMADTEIVPAPRLLLAGLVDAGGLKAFGHVTAETPDEGRAVVGRYHEHGFEQIKLYTYLTPEVVKAIAEEAHRLGMTVIGHVPQAMNAFEGVEAGMDQINHLNYVSRLMRTPEDERKAVQFFREHHTVVDPTAGWGEMAGHAKDVDVASFEPGITRAPFVLDAKYRGMGGTAGAEPMRARMAQTLSAIGALHKAGVTIVPGTDTGLVGYGLYRELELYVQAGMTPMEAIQSATLVSARAMKLERESGTIEAGKRADLVLVNGNPLADIHEMRKVTRVVASGRLYDSERLWRSVGFQ